MKNALKLTYALMLALALTTFSCNNDDEGAINTVNNEISVQNLDITIDENPANGQTISTVEAESESVLSFSITSQTPTSALGLDASSGELTVADATLFDFETNPEITANISVSNSENNETVSVTISLNDLNEIAVQDLTVTIDENPTNGQSVGTVPVDGNGPFSFSIESQTPVGALDIDASTGELTVADAALFDFETNPTITGTIAVVGAGNLGTFTINLNDLDEITAEDLTVTIDENPTDGQFVGSVIVNGGGNLSFSITSQTPAGALNIDQSTGELTVIDPNLFDFETNPVITANISVDNSVNITTAVVTINLNDVDEIVTQNLTVALDENPSNGQVIGTLQANSNETLTYTITYQSTAGALNINSSTGELTVADAALFDFETNPTMFATISVENAVSSVSASATINLNDLNEIGEFKHGGVIFWIDPASSNNGGLVCDINDLNGSMERWNNGNNISTGATAISIGSGQANTSTIINVQGTGIYAASLCDNLTLNGYDDWFLPSSDELEEVLSNKSIIDVTAAANSGTGIGTDYYWSSTETSSGSARIILVSNNIVMAANGNKGVSLFYVRAVRAF